MRDLSLSEELLVLLTGENGRSLSSSVDLALAGCVLAELLLDGHLRVEGEGRRSRVHEVKPLVTDHPFYVSAWAAMAKKGFGKKPSTLVTAVGSGKRTKLLREALASEGMLQREARRFLFFRWNHYTLNDAAVRTGIIDELKNALSSDGPVDDGAAVLIALLSVTGTAKRVLGREFAREHRARIKDMADEAGHAAEAVKQAIAAVQASAAVIASTAAVGAASG
ncbi:GOLPH3/VPS74 family protein [Parvularcula maris]|uniref:GPP34 family phosphoprotein n=1 Tax=Parvularcula maris TaxID=2965077 RepID=A0A9X2RIQ9_9PROT|nr:GPP34 family phosphoprotein [Parvularcula maris]MCQ8184112.1 GPP34 family phosphoprotein [Parvularcula maris]